jgi:hypothetical protein
VGTSASMRTILVMNPFASKVSIVIGPLSIAGSNGFTLVPSSTTCAPGHTLAPDGQCQVAIKYTATALGAQSAAVTIVDNASNSPHLITLGGTGI